MLPKLILSAALATLSLFAAGDTNATLIERVSALPSVKAHGYVPLKVQSQGQLYVAYGYFDVPGRTPADKHRKVFADMYLSPDLKTAVYGDGYNTQTGSHYVHTDMAAVKKTSALTIGHGPLQLYLVSDPHCPYCKRFEKELAAYEDLVTVHVVLISLPMHPKAPDAIRCVLSKPKTERETALLAIADGKNACEGGMQNPDVFALQMEAMETSASMLRVKGTPSLYLEDGAGLELNAFFKMMQDTREKNAKKVAVK